ncbi:iap-3 [Spodoptera litura granulovirus]|uniref:Iap-3 n=1 Tax=Spodoptera litura granulovirus TaxID=359919 RepID=A5IZL8_9BBAC|nr:iap-3 [Spodoptera litura granulovirus]ABQ51959.1 iap-3 [Spodoptera litura granulovirus]ACV04868.1 iap-3 [Spodoptera litura granulovirus]
MAVPTHPMYDTVESRLASFKNWTKTTGPKPEELADAGFYYVGEGDKTKCFHCNGGLNHWQDDDVAWEQHAFWFSRCAYVLLIKGESYVDRVMNKINN